MKTILHTTLAVLLLSGSGYSQTHEVEANSEIKDVTVFTTAAQITRRSKVTLREGYNKVVFANLSPFINPSSIQISTYKGTTVMSTNHAIDYLADKMNDSEFDILIDERDDLIYDREKIRIKRRNLEKEKGLIYRNKSVKSKTQGLSIEDLMDMSDFYQDRLRDINVKLIAVDGQIQEYTDEINKINKQLQEKRALANKSKGEISITIKADKAGSGEFVLSYVVRNAGWYPRYDLRSEKLGDDLDFTYKAMVYQQTGSDWDNVKLKLSTGDPARSSTPPTVYPWRLQKGNSAYYSSNRRSGGSGGRAQWQTTPRFENAPYQNRWTAQDVIAADTTYNLEGGLVTGTLSLLQEQKELQDQIYALDAEVDMLEKSREEVAAFVPGVSADASIRRKKDRYSTADNTGVTETSVNTIFDIETPYSIPTDGKQYGVEVQAFEVPAIYEYYCAPRSNNDVFLVAKAPDWDALNILPGTSSIYFQGTFVGEAYINPNVTQDTLELSLGRDKNVIIERKLIKDYSKKTTVGSSRKITRGYQIKVRNTRSQAVSLSLVDQIPVSTNKEIKITLVEKDGAKHNLNDGKLQWDLNIPAGETKTLTFKFEVRHPKDYSIPNL